MAKIETEGFVLTSIKYGDYDRLMHVLTKDRGIVTVKARGASRGKNALALASSPFIYAKFDFFQSGDRYSLDGASIIDSFPFLTTDIESLATVSHMVEVILDLERNGSVAEDTYRLYRATMAALKKWGRPRLSGLAFCFRLLSLHGFTPWLVNSVVSGDALIKPYVYTYEQRGMCLQSELRVKERFRTISETELTTLNWLLQAPYEKYLAFKIDDQESDRVFDFCMSFLEEVMEKRYHRLNWLNSIEDFGKIR